MNTNDKVVTGPYAKLSISPYIWHDIDHCEDPATYHYQSIIRTKRAFINVKNKDNKCFMWSVLAALCPSQRDAERIWKYKNLITSLKFNGLLHPVKMADIPKFETQNDISVNVFGLEQNEVFPVHIANNPRDLCGCQQYIRVCHVSITYG